MSMRGDIEVYAALSKRVGYPTPELVHALRGIIRKMGIQKGIPEEERLGEAVSALEKGLADWQPERGSFKMYYSYVLKSHYRDWRLKTRVVPLPLSNPRDHQQVIIRPDGMTEEGDYIPESIYGCHEHDKDSTEIDLLCNHLDAEEEQIFRLMVAQYSSSDIAAHIGYSKTKTLRIIRQIREVLARIV